MYKNNLIAENKVIITTSDSFNVKNFFRRNAAVSDLYDGKSKNKIAVVFFF